MPPGRPAEPVVQALALEEQGLVEDDVTRLQEENAQLRALCSELEQALQEATAQHGGHEVENHIKELEQLLDEKSEMIRRQHQQIQELQSASDGAARTTPTVQPASAHRHNQGPAPREDELLALSEELERERRQLQEDEDSLMEQMRQMEVTMARERAEMARQRTELMRLQSEIRHEIERLERNGALQSKMETLKTRLNDVSARRGASPGASSGQVPAPNAPTPAPAAPRKESLLGRLFGQGR